jgi:tetratricopeptide (TPR) repeat protein/TolB-like protein
MAHILAVAATLALLAPQSVAAAAQTPPGSRILVVPFENIQHEPRLHWLSEASAVLLTDQLNARGLGAIARDERIRAFEQLHLPLTASLSHATVIKVGHLVGATEVVVGTLTLEGDNLKVEAHSIRIDVGRLQPDVSERAPLTDLFAIFDRLAGRLAPDARVVAGNGGTRPPLDAFENYVKGLIAESPAVQVNFLETAAKMFPRYDRAELALWSVRSDQDDHAGALAAARAVPAGSPLARRARFLSGVSLVELKRNDEAFDVFKALTHDVPAPGTGARNPGIAAALNNLGIVQIRRGSTPQAGTATFYLTKAAEADPGDADYLFNLGYAYVLEGNAQGAIYWLREGLRRDPADPDAHYVLAAALLGSGSGVEAAREKALARQLSSRYEELERRAAADKLPVPKGLERMRMDPDTPGGLSPEQTIVNSAQRDQRELATFHLERGRRLYEREADSEAMVELRRAVYLLPYEAQAHLLIGRIHLRAGRPQEAVNALKISIWSEDTAAARVALAQAYLKLQNTGAAKIELDRALVLDPASADAKRMLAEIK